MAVSNVYYTNMRTTLTENLLQKLERLVKKAGMNGYWTLTTNTLQSRFTLASPETWLTCVPTTPRSWWI